jgi:AcrR family transcriptional regulator
MATLDEPETSAEETPRAIARRRQILDAAALCFRRYGFHACSMAQIAEAAGMSVGHIYRYFIGKEAIIAAIVREDVDRILAEMADFQLTGPNLKADLIERCAEGVMKSSNLDDAALMIEIRAEAARNPAVRKMVNEGDAEITTKLRQIIATAIGRPISPADLEARVEMFHLIFQGVGLRTVINPEIDRQALSRLAILAIDAILSQ